MTFNVGDIVKFKSGIGKIQDHLLIELSSDNTLYLKVVKSVHQDVGFSLKIHKDKFDLLERVSRSNYNRRKVQFKYVKV